VQSALLKEYPNRMLVTATQCVFSMMQSFVVAVVAERGDMSKWKLRCDITLVAVLYVVIISRIYLLTYILIEYFFYYCLFFSDSCMLCYRQGFVVTGLSHYLQAWCMELKGPVFLAMTNPLCFVFTIFSSSFFLGEIVHLGSILGGALLVAGLYSVHWGKLKEDRRSEAAEQEKTKPQEEPAAVAGVPSVLDQA
jgi:hypothetical protein